MNKRVRIVTTGTYPDGMASTYRIHCYAKALLKEGVSVEVVSARSQRKYSGRFFNYYSVFDNVPYTIIINGDNPKIKWLSYLWAELNSYILLAHCLFTFRKYDLLWLYGLGVIPRLLLVPALHLVGKKVILELNEYPYSNEGNKLTRIPIVQRLLKWTTFRVVFPQLDGIVVISERLRLVASTYSPMVPVLKVPILVEAREYHATSKRSRLNDAPHPYLYLFHAGSLSTQKDGIIAVVQAYANAAVELRKMSIRLDLVFTNNKTLTNVWEKIKQILITDNLWGQLKITGYLGESELQSYLRHACALIINKPPCLQNNFNFPTKLGDYLLSGRPVIAAAKGIELNNFIVNDVNGCIVPPNDVQEMSKALVNLCLNTEKADELGAAGQELALKLFDYRKNSRAIKDFLNLI